MIKSCSSIKTFYTNINQIPVTKDGIDEYFYPVKPGETTGVREDLAIEIVNLLKEIKKTSNSYIDESIILVFHIISDVMCVYQAQLALKRLKEYNVKVEADDNSRIYKSLVEDSLIGSPAILKQLQAGPAPTRKILAPARLVRELLISDGIKRRWFKGPDYNKDIITFSVEPFLSNHARTIEQDVFFVRYNEWYKNIASPLGNTIDKSTIVELLEKIISETFIKTNLRYTPKMKEYFTSWIDKALELVGIYKNSILSSKKQLPMILWTHSGGNIWARMIRYFAKKNGATVVGHTHGTGVGFFSDYGRTMTLLEYEGCTEYVVYTKGSVSTYKKTARKDLLVEGMLPSIYSVKTPALWYCDNKRAILNKTLKNNKFEKEKIVLYIPSLYIGETVFDGALVNDYIVLDWEIRLLQYLVDIGYRIRLRPHPEQGFVPKGITDIFGKYIISDEALGDALDLADVILTDQPCSSVFSSVILSKKPIVFIDFNVQEFTPDGWEKLNGRCAVVKGFYDGQNRAHIKWKQLDSAIKKSGENISNSFANSYFLETA